MIRGIALGIGLICVVVCAAMIKAASDADRAMKELMQCMEDEE